MAATAVKEGPKVRVSTLIGMAVMDALDAGAKSGTIYLHHLSRDTRRALIERLVRAGGVETPTNDGGRSVQLGGVSVTMWLASSERCPECGGSGVDRLDRGERCPVCKGRG